MNYASSAFKNRALKISLICLFAILGRPVLEGRFSAANSDPAKGEVITFFQPKLLEASELDDDSISVIVTGTTFNAAKNGVIGVGGEITAELPLINAVGAEILGVDLVELGAHPGIATVIKNEVVAASAEKIADYGSAPNKIQISNSLPAQVGVDQLHAQGITGQGVTIAVLDSGNFVPPELRATFGDAVGERMLGQADFVDEGDCPLTAAGFTQNGNYCLTNWETSYDPNGHGSHVTGIIWNPYREEVSGQSLAIAPEAKILSVRVLDEDGVGDYIDVIEGIQYVIDNKDLYGIDVINISLSANVSVPYFADPLNRAVEAAWAAGLTVVTAAGNSGNGPLTVSVPGNDPYVITVGALNTQLTPANFDDDRIPFWSGNGPTHDGFIKPDIVAPGTDIVSIMYLDPTGSNSPEITDTYPEFSQTESLFVMNGTSMSTAVVSGVVALMKQANPSLTPDQIKYRLMASAKAAETDNGDPAFNVLQQGAGRVWAPDAVTSTAIPNDSANQGMDLAADLANPSMPVSPPTGSDSDGDGVDDLLDLCPYTPLDVVANEIGCFGDLNTSPADSDGDGIPDIRDLDSDNDGKSDLKESGFDTAFINSVDQNGNGQIDAGVELGANGAADLLERSADSGVPKYLILDSDGNGSLDFTASRYHYQGPIKRKKTKDGKRELYEMIDPVSDKSIIVGLTDTDDNSWLDLEQANLDNLIIDDVPIDVDLSVDGSGRYFWGGGRYFWGGGRYFWGGGRYFWGGGRYFWGGGLFAGELQLSDGNTSVESNMWQPDRQGEPRTDS